MESGQSACSQERPKSRGGYKQGCRLLMSQVVAGALKELQGADTEARSNHSLTAAEWQALFLVHTTEFLSFIV